MLESEIDKMFKKIKQGKEESDFRYKQRVIVQAEKYKNDTAMANGFKHQYVKPANRVGHLEGLDGRKKVGKK